ncbi:hypothetical protein ES703_41386 [subsurface metagenome]
MEFSSVIFGFLPNILYLVAWIVAVIFAVRMMRYQRGRAERFLLAGASLMLVQSLIAIPTTALSTWLIVDRGMANVEVASVLSIFGLVRGCIGLAGIICLVYAFWIKFKASQD